MREREGACVCQRERARERRGKRVCVFVGERASNREGVCERESEREKERGR